MHGAFSGLAHNSATVCFHRALDMTRDIQQGLLLILRIPYPSILTAATAVAQHFGTCAPSHISVMC